MDTSTRTIRILICDDHAIFAETLAYALEAQDDFEVCSTVTTIDRAKQSFALEPDVAIVDVRMGDENGLHLVSWIATNHPSCRSIVLTAYDSDEFIIGAHEAGAKSFVVKSISCDYLVSAIRDVAAGFDFLTPEYVATARERLEGKRSRHFESLSSSDRQLVSLIAEGLPDRQIAAEMHLSLQTIRNRVSRLLKILNLDNRTQLAVLVARSDD